MRLKIVKKKIKLYEDEFYNLMSEIPNLLSDYTPEGNKYQDNIVIEKYDKPFYYNLDQKLLFHWELGSKYDILDFKSSSKITGNGFVVYKKQGALLQRALINFFLDSAIKNGYKEINVPLLVNSRSAWNTGQIPDKNSQMYHLKDDDYYLIPTSEIPLINLYSNNTIPFENLPVKLTAISSCFRREAGSYGRNTKGLNRLHEFFKVELVKITSQETSEFYLNLMLKYVKNILNELQLPYRVLLLCSGELNNTSSLTYDIEVYSIKQKKWLEVSSISNCLTYQSNRSNIFYKENKIKKLAHTINGSGLALPRIMAAILENNQSNNGIIIPKCLTKYTNFSIIK
ncbi:MAG: serine--tRNA ligase [Bacteroides sp.]|nr:MAG: serine--tRNA ligase [Bacteroides sp.]